MLGVVPIRRKSVGSILGWTAYNLLLTSPFVIAYWILTETRHGANRGCFGIPWDVANFARWAFLGFAIYQIFSLPFNFCVMKRSRKIGRESRFTHWMQMFDVLHWIANWALWYYIITALANRAQCHDSKLNDLFWANVFISAAFALVGLIIGLVTLGKFIAKMLREIAEESKLRTVEGVDVVVARGGLHQGMKQGVGVEILEVRKSTNPELDRVRVRPEYIDKYDVRREDVIDKAERRVLGDGIPAEKKDEGIITREEIRQRESIRERSDPRYMGRDERLDIDDTLPTNTNDIRTYDVRAGQPRKF